MSNEEFSPFDWPRFEDVDDVSEYDPIEPTRVIEVFDLSAISAAKQYSLELDAEQRQRFEKFIVAMSRNNGFRTVPGGDDEPQQLRAMRSQFENLAEVIDRLAIDLTIAGAMDPQDFHIAPVLLVGPPGFGKTYFSILLSKAIGLTFYKISAGTAQAGFQFAGTSSHWQNAQPGELIRMMAESDSASPILIVDEVDKMSSDGERYPFMPVLLDTLEPVTARVFRDECVRVSFDASKMITILTANSLDCVPAPLLSRVEVIEVPAPEPSQRLRIIENEMASLRRKTNTAISLPEAVAVQLAERVDLDLRKTTRIVRDAFAVALAEKSTVAVLRIPRSAKRTMGFM